MPKEPGGVHAQEAAGHHQDGGGTHQKLARGTEHLLGPFQGQNFLQSSYLFCHHFVQ